MTSKPSQSVSQKGKNSRVRVIIVDDHTFMRDLMARTLAPDFSVVAAVGTAKEAVEVCAKLKPDVLILDVNLPDRSGIDTLPELKRIAPKTRVLLCTAFPIDQPIARLMESGAQGYVEKTNTWHDFLSAVDRVSRGELYFCSNSRGSAVMSSRRSREKGHSAEPSNLTRREKEVTVLLAQGLTSKEIAAKLNISVATVDTHRTNTMTKLGVHNVAALTSFAFRAGLMSSSMAAPAGHTE